VIVCKLCDGEVRYNDRANRWYHFSLEDARSCKRAPIPVAMAGVNS